MIMNHVGTVLTYHLQKKIRWIGPKMTELWQIFCGDVNFLENQPFGQIRHFGAIFNWGSRPQFLGNRPDSFFVVLIYITKFGGNHFWGPSGPTGRELRGGRNPPPPALNKLAESPPWIGLTKAWIGRNKNVQSLWDNLTKNWEINTF